MIDIPLFEAVKEKKRDEFGEIRYSCNIRRLTDPRSGGTMADGSTLTDKKQRFSYVFRTEEIDNLSFNFLVADAVLDKRQTYLLVEAEDSEDPNSTEIDTRVELCLGGDITIGGTSEINEKLGKVNERLKDITDKLPMQLKMPGIHFTKMRLSNIAHDKWKTTNAEVLAVRKRRMDAEQEAKVIKVLYEAKEHELVAGACYLNLGEWSLASPQKKIGPFLFKLNDYGFDFNKTSGQIKLDLNGDIEFNELVCVGAGVTISSKLEMPKKKTDLSGYSLSDGDVKFNEIHLGVDVAGVFKFDGKLKIDKEGDNPGYTGTLDIDVAELFSLKCEGGYYEHKGETDEDKAEKKEAAEKKAADEKKVNPKTTMTWQDFYDEDPSYAWGYFKVAMESRAGLRFDPVVINSISGGFYFNCSPTPGEDKEKGKFDGAPAPKYGMIGVALGLGMSTTAGEETLNMKVDLLVAYDRKAGCLSTFLFNGKLEAVGGIVKADVSMVYQNELKKNRYLCLNVTVEGGMDTKAITEKANGLNGKLGDLQKKLNEFQSKLDKADLYQLVTNPQQGLGQLSGDYEKNEGGTAPEGNDENQHKKEKTGEAAKGPDVTAGKLKVPIEFKITWIKDGEKYPTPKWHLYVGEPAKDKRCTYTYLYFKSAICTVDIGADGYLCVGNELPDGGALPDIPQKITEFLNGHQNEGADTGADMEKVNRSRAAAVRALLKSADSKGGVMVGASCWGNIDINLGLLYGKIESLAGFDASLVHYGNNAFCVNSRSSMGKNGWYAMGQLYAYLGGELGIHIKIGHLIDEKISIINAGMGGVLQMGLPNPSWVEGQCRVKMSFLGGLAKVNKKFEFSAGDHCVPFQGNALDGFELFQNVSLGSDSLYEALVRPEFAISAADAKRMTFTTTSSLGSHYRLVDPSYQADIASDIGEEAEKLSLHASRTYVFDMNQDRDTRGMKMGVRLIDMGTRPNEIVKANPNISPAQFLKELNKKTDGVHYDGRISNLMQDNKVKQAQLKGLANQCRDFASFAATYFSSKAKATAETSTVMKGRSIDKGEDFVLHETNLTSYIDVILNNNKFNNTEEVDVSFREDRGTTFHLTGMDLKPGHSYALVLTGDAYEIENGRRVWCAYVDTTGSKPKSRNIHWKQSKLWFFRVKDAEQNAIVGDSIRNLEQYVALAYPSVDGTRVISSSEGYTTAYIKDLMHPTIALNRDISTELPKGTLKWKLTAYHESDTARWHETQERDANYVRKGNCVNLEPTTAFNRFTEFTTSASQTASAGKTYNFGDELYHLQLTHTYTATVRDEATKRDVQRDSVVKLVDLWLTAAPHDVNVPGKGTVDDTWMQTTSKDLTGELLPYVRPFVGARPWADPTIAYASGERQLSDQDIVFDNSKQYKSKPYRLIDPYLYLAYLSKWTFIGDRTINSYAWDDAKIPFGSESLIFERNGRVINAEFLKGETSKSLVEVRNEMYRTWNDWYYNNSANNPMYPLPVTTQTIGGPTVVNQDGRTSTITPLNVNHYSDQIYNLTNLVNDFAAPYSVANNMCRSLRRHALDLFDELAWNMEFNNGKVDDKTLNSSILKWNQLHRGQYITCTTGDVTAKVPFYQLPLIFGDCFGGNAKYLGESLSGDKRSFSHTIGKSDITDKTRWPSESSNILFFRLTGNPNHYGYIPMAFNRYSAGKADNCYLNPVGSANQMHIGWDEFDMKTALEAVTSFKARIYRVDSYNISTGQYTVSNVGGGPWTHEETIDAASGVATNLSEMAEAAEASRKYLNSHYDKPVPQVFWSEDGELLSFIYSDSIYIPGQKFKDKPIWKVWKGEEVESAPWQQESMVKEVGGKITSYMTGRLVKEVYFDQSFANADIRRTYLWFNDFAVLTKITGLQYLNTSKVTHMSSMFNRCENLKSIDLSKFNLQNVTDMGSMLANCKKLTTVTLPSDAPKVENIAGLFSGCESLTSIDMKTFVAKKATKTATLFWGCRKLSQLHMEKLSPEDVQEYGNMFKDVSKSVNVYYAYDLDDRIKEQIPGTKHEQDNPVKALYVSMNGQLTLLFINTTDNITKNRYNTIKGQTKSYGSLYVYAIWSKDEVLNTKNKRPWNSSKSSFVKVIIDPSFKDSPVTTAHWFDGFTALTNIVGLENLNTKKVTDMSYMFNGCAKLTSINAGKFNTEQVTDMQYMFSGCSSLVDLDISGFNTKQVTNMVHMFDGCSLIPELNLGNHFSTPNVTDFTAMFKNCSVLEEINADYSWSFSTAKATSTSEMFAGCTKLKSIYGIAPFDLQSVTNMSSMFSGCKAMDETLSRFVSNFTTRNVTNMKEMFKGCSGVHELDLTNFYTPKVTDMSSLFNGCSSLNTLNLCNLSTESMKQCGNMFTSVPTSSTIYLNYDVSQSIYPNQVKESTHPNLVIIYPAQVIRVKNGDEVYQVFLSSRNAYGPGSKWNGMKVTEVYSGMDVIKSYHTEATTVGSGREIVYTPSWCERYGNPVTKVIIDPSFAQVRPLSTAHWFAYMKELKKIEGLQHLNTSDVETMQWMFSDCPLLKEIPGLNTLNTAKVKNMAGMFSGCESLTSIDLSNFNTAKVTDMNNMFRDCKALKSLDLSHFDISNLEEVTSMFHTAEKLEHITMPQSYTNKVTKMWYVFLGCSSLTEVDLTPFKVTKLEDAGGIFEGCGELKRLTLGDTFNVEGMSKSYGQRTFEGVHGLLVKAPEEQRPFMRIAFIANLGFVEGETGWFDNGEVERVPQAIWTEDDKTLTFVYEPLHTVGTKFNGQTITKVWSGNQVMDASSWGPWRSTVSSKVTTVRFEKSFSELTPTSLSHWFYGCGFTTIEGLENLNTSKVTDMSCMFWNCMKLTELDLSSFNTASVTDISSMFKGCSALKSLDLSNFNVRKVTRAYSLFAYCNSLTSLKVGGDFIISAVGSSPYVVGTVVLTPIFERVKNLHVKVPEAYLADVKACFTSKMGFVEGASGNGTFDDETAMAIWTANNKTFTLCYGPALKTGDTYNGQTVTNVWKGADVTNTKLIAPYSYAPWTQTIRNSSINIVIDKSFSQVRPKKTASWFIYLTVSAIKGLEYLNTSETTNMCSMFHGLKATSIDLDLSTFNTSKVTDMSSMFKDCSVKSLNLNGFNTTNVKLIYWMFYNFAPSNRKLDITSFNTSKVQNASDIFRFKMSDSMPSVCELFLGDDFTLDNLSGGKSYGFTDVMELDVMVPNLESLDALRQTLTNKFSFVEGTTGRFVTPGSELIQAVWTEGNTTLTFMLANEYKKGDMYKGSKVTAVWTGRAITESNPDGFPAWSATVRDKVTKVVFDKSFASVQPKCLRSWFNRFTKLTTISNIGNLNTSKVTNMQALFYDCSSLTSLNVSSFDTKNVTTFEDMFYGCSGLQKLDLSKWNTENATVMTAMFRKCSGLTSLTLKNLKTRNVTKMGSMFRGCSSLTSIDVSGLDIWNVKSLYYFFAGCSKLKSIDLKNFNTYSLTSTSHMFEGCSALTSVDLGYTNCPNFKLDKVTNMESMFKDCTALKTVTMQSGSNGSMASMFENCSSLTSINISGAKPTSLQSAFQNCTALTSFSLEWLMTENTKMNYMFYGCTSLTSVYMPLTNTKNVEYWNGMFNGCSKLKTWTVGRNLGADKMITKQNMFKNTPDDMKVIIRLRSSDMYLESSIRNALKKLGNTKTIEVE